MIIICDEYFQNSALDKLLGQLGIYATWFTSFAYLHKQLRIFIFFTPCFFWWLHVFLLHEAIWNVLAYLFTPRVRISKASNLRILLYLKQISFPCWHSSVHFAKFHFHYSIFPRNTGLGTDIFFIKLELYCGLASKKKKINTQLAFVYHPNGNAMDKMVRNDIACNCIPIVRIAFRYACISFKLLFWGF